ncbi:hypothetical protein VITFI_CDS1718 [Vitreoscilla filiformis]|uniref:Calcium-binding protein n=1 Tax=Vitreoscilla filiformis TaxID=63 RepID=A0A221KER2_VITFI|nr:calcium-binding protein [Vitreoscilla filiformis]ASM77496.1 hypothetical protein VITFI_CDS1718 [Vitreoscilla filiformis]
MSTTTLTSGNDTVTLYEGFFGQISGSGWASLRGVTLDGATGTDVLIVDYPDSIFTLTESTSGVVTLSTASGGSVSLANFEQIQFQNAVVDLTPAVSTSPTAGNDVLTGSAGHDQLSALAGQDTLIGAAGNDTLDGGTGSDTLDGGAGRDRLLGQAGNDTLTGGTGADTLAGGTGHDTLSSGAGQDVFLFNAPLQSGASSDLIQDFSGSDRIALDDAVFHLGITGTAAGVSLASRPATASVLVQGTQALGTEDRLVYDAHTGQLFYDPTGSALGSSDQVLVATLGTGTHPNLSASDFWVV